MSKNKSFETFDLDTLGAMSSAEAHDALGSRGFQEPGSALKNLTLLAKTPFTVHIDAIVRAAVGSPSPDGALNNLESIAVACGNSVITELLKEPDNLTRLVTIAGSSHQLSSFLRKYPGSLTELLIEGGLYKSKAAEEILAEATAATEASAEQVEFERAIRVYRNREYLRLGARDLLSLSTVQELTRELSDLASASLEAALLFATKNLQERYGVPLATDQNNPDNPNRNRREAEVSVIGLGKLGGRELNFSSDIDILFVYSTDSGRTTGIEPDPTLSLSEEKRERIRERSQIGLHDYFSKLSTHISKLLSNVTEDGFVFRVDLDLRPEGRSGPMANSLHSLEVYYETWGQSWERAAMLKARPVAGSKDLGEQFLTTVYPFVFRKYLDFSAIEEIKRMKEKIDLSLLRRKSDTIDVKLGTGGIREIEFFCQALQLIHAGKDPSVRDRSTLSAILKLLAKGFIKESEAATLTDGYIFLRNLEHKIQIVEGRQTQVIPANRTELIRCARMMGFRTSAEVSDYEAFWEKYRSVTGAVHAVYKSLFYLSEEEAEKVPEAFRLLFAGVEAGVEFKGTATETEAAEADAKKQLAALGFTDAVSALKSLALLRKGPGAKRLGARAQDLLERLGPRFLELASKSPEPNRALKNLERFLSVVGARTAYYALLAENPRVLSELVKLFGTSEFLSSDLVEHPENLDILLSEELAIAEKSAEELSLLFTDEVLGNIKAEGETVYEEQLDLLRRVKNRELFRIGLNDISGALPAPKVPRQMTLMAEAALQTAITIGTKELHRLYGAPAAETRFTILGLGKFGGSELLYGSDLDIIFLYSVPTQEQASDNGNDDNNGTNGRFTTDGPREISNHEYFAKLCQRIVSILTLRTREGLVFPVDTRLRPSGNAGPLAVTGASFIKYHKGETAIWERQAMTRARVVAGDAEFGNRVLGEVNKALYSKPLTENDISEMLRIRERMGVEIAKESATRFNLKSGAGGLIDIEFLTQAMQLAYGSEVPDAINPETLGALNGLAEAKKIPYAEYEFLRETYLFYRLLETRLRIVHDRAEGFLTAKTDELDTLAKSSGYGQSKPGGPGLGMALLDDYRALSTKVREQYLKRLEELKHCC
jgi:glutamate-ammonia-ligase adenylyltransferase